MNELLNISPIDGRYHEKTKELSDYFSEYALIKYRTIVEIKWLLYLLDKKIIDESINEDEKNNILSIINKKEKMQYLSHFLPIHLQVNYFST